MVIWGVLPAPVLSYAAVRFPFGLFFWGAVCYNGKKYVFASYP